MGIQVETNSHDAIELLNSIDESWEIRGAKFFNDYAIFALIIDGKETKHRLRLNRKGTWSFQAEVEL